MREFLFSTRLPDGREVCIAPISVDAFEDNGAHNLGDDSGYFIYEYDSDRSESGIEILAKAASYDAAMRIIDIFLSVQSQATKDHRALSVDAPLRSPPAQHQQAS
jgi:hypothetical protein